MGACAGNASRNAGGNVSGGVDAAGDEDPCNGSAGKGKGSKWSGKDFVDSDLGNVPMRAAETDDVGVIATNGDGAGGSGGVE